MTDIMERLRAKADRYEFAEQFDDESLAKEGLLKTRALILEAADEIDRLRDALRDCLIALEMTAPKDQWQKHWVVLG